MARIAIGIEDVNRRGGQERVICELLWRLAGRHEIDLVCYRAEDIPEQVRLLRVRDPGRLSLFLRALWFIPASTWRLRGGRYDAVIAQGANLWNPTHVIAHTCHASRSRTRREVRWRRSPPGWLKRLEYAVRDPVLGALERRMARRCRGRIIAVGQTPQRNFRRHYGLSEDDIVVAENGVDHERFHPSLRDIWRAEMRKQLGIPEETFVALFVGGLWQEKGLARLIEALGLMRHRDARLVVVGSGDEAELGRHAEARGVRDRVLFTGRTTTPERFYAMADGFLFVSEVEGFALVTLEAAASGLPLILAAGDTPAELLEDGVSGFAVPPDASAIAAKLDVLASDPDFRRRAGEEAYRRSLRYSWERQAQEIEAFVLGSAGP